MATFHDIGCYQRLDYRLLQNGPVSLYFRSETLASDENALKALGYIVRTIDTSLITQKEDLLTQIGRALDFPDYYGKNLDALNDCLSDLTIPEDSGILVEFLHFDAIFSRIPDLAWAVLDIFAANARHHLLFGRRLIIALQSGDPKILIDPVGALSPCWNPKEWLNKDRGL